MSSAYFPSGESRGGWRRLSDRASIRAVGIDEEKLEDMWLWHLSQQTNPPAEPSPIGFLVIKDGWIVFERYERPETKDWLGWTASIGKSMTSCLFGRWLDAGSRGTLRFRFDLESAVYDKRYLPEGFPLSDPTKEEIRFIHILTHTSGLKASPDPSDGQKFRFVDYTVGRSATHSESKFLAYNPGTGYAYSNVAYNHFAVIGPNVTGRALHEEIQAQLLAPIGIETAIWHDRGEGYTYNGRAYQPSAVGPNMTIRDLARFAYLLLREGRWEGNTIVPAWYLREATKVHWFNDGQPDNYGLGMRTNWQQGLCDKLPRDAFAIAGAGLNVAVIVPSYDLIAVRTSQVRNIDTHLFTKDFARLVAESIH